MDFEIGITMLIHNKDDIEFVTEFPCLLGHPVYKQGSGLIECTMLYMVSLP